MDNVVTQNGMKTYVTGRTHSRPNLNHKTTSNAPYWNTL